MSKTPLPEFPRPTHGEIFRARPERDRSYDWIGGEELTESGGLVPVIDRWNGGVYAWPFSGAQTLRGRVIPAFTELTIAFWIKQTGTPSADETIIGNLNAGDGWTGFSVGFTTARKINFYVDRGASGQDESDVVLPDNVWTHVCCRWKSNGNFEIFFNGEQVSFRTFATGTVDSSVALYIGSYIGSSSFLSADMDDPVIILRGIDDDEIAELATKRNFQLDMGYRELNLRTHTVASNMTRDDYTGTVGGDFTVGHDCWLYRLGRPAEAALNVAHRVMVWDQSSGTLLTETTLDSDSSYEDFSPERIYYANCEPIFLRAGTTYTIASNEVSTSGDEWQNASNADLFLETDGDVTYSRARFGSTDAHPTGDGGADVTYVLHPMWTRRDKAPEVHIAASPQRGDTPIDHSGNGNVGTLVGGVSVTNDFEKNGRSAYLFDGVDGLIDLGFDPLSDSQEHTVAFWANAAVSGVSLCPIGNWGGDDTLLIRFTGTTIQAYMNAGSQVGGDIVTNYVIGEWVHIAARFGRTDESFRYFDVFINGTLEYSIGYALSASTNTSSNSLKIGYSNSGSGVHFNGMVEAVQIHQSVMSDAEIETLAGDKPGRFSTIDDKLVLRVSPTNDPYGVANTTAKNFVDLSDVTLENGLGYDTTDKDFGGVASLDCTGASDHYADCGPVRIGGTEWSVTLWYYRPAFNNGVLFSRYESTGNKRSLRVQQSSATVYVRVSPDGGTGNIDDVTLTETLNSNEWNFVALSFKDGTLRSNVNGVEQTQTLPTATSVQDDPTTPFQLNNAQLSNPADCKFDEVRGYQGRALQHREMQRLFAMGRPGEEVSYNQQNGFGVHSPHPADVNFIRAEEGSGTALADSSPEGNNGTLTGSWVTGANPWSSSAVHIAGTTDGVVLDSSLAGGDGQPFSITGYYKGQAGGSGRIIGRTDNFGERLRQVNDTRIDFTDEGGGTISFTVPSIGSTNWHSYRLIRYADEVLELFWDGVSVGTSGPSSSTDGPMRPNVWGRSGSTGGGDSQLDEMAVRYRALNTVEGDENEGGPEPIGTSVPSLGAVTEGISVSTNLTVNTFALPPEFSGTNGLIVTDFFVEQALDGLGTDRARIAESSWTPAAGDVGTFVRLGVFATNNGGQDQSEVWHTDWVLVQASGGGGTPVNVTAGSGIVSVTGHAPSVAIGAGVSVTAGSGQVSVAGHAPAVARGVRVSAETGSVSVAGHTPSVSIGQAVSVAAGSGSVSVTGYPTATRVGKRTAAGPGAVSVTGHAPTVSAGNAVQVTAGAGTISVSGGVPDVHVGTRPSPAAGTVTVVGHAPSTVIGARVAVTPGAGSVQVSGHAPTINVGDGQDRPRNRSLRPDDLRRDTLRAN